LAGEYGALWLLAAVSAVGLPGPGDSALIAAGLLAADGYLSLPVVLVTAFVGCLAGRAAGYWLGSAGGCPLIQRPGPLHGFRHKTLEKGDALFTRYPRFAPLLAPAVVSGIYRVSWRMFAIASALAGTTWVLSTALGGYFIGPAAADILADIGVRGAIAIVIISALGLLGRRLWRSRDPHTTQPTSAQTHGPEDAATPTPTNTRRDRVP
jgi:membrane protein DedA with SNARE-associated domain